MGARYAKPSADDFAACEVPLNLIEEIQKCFRELATPFGELLDTEKERYYFYSILEGLASNVRKNLESIAYAHDRNRQMSCSIIS